MVFIKNLDGLGFGGKTLFMKHREGNNRSLLSYAFGWKFYTYIFNGFDFTLPLYFPFIYYLYIKLHICEPVPTTIYISVTAIDDVNV